MRVWAASSPRVCFSSRAPLIAVFLALSQRCLLTFSVIYYFYGLIHFLRPPGLRGEFFSFCVAVSLLLCLISSSPRDSLLNIVFSRIFYNRFRLFNLVLPVLFSFRYFGDSCTKRNYFLCRWNVAVARRHCARCESVFRIRPVPERLLDDFITISLDTGYVIR